QDPGDHALARRAPPLPPALHPDQLVLAEPGRTLVRAAHRQAATPPRPQIPSGTGERHPHLGHHLEREPATVRLAQDRRRNLRTTQHISSTDSRRRTLVWWCQQRLIGRPAGRSTLVGSVP